MPEENGYAEATLQLPERASTLATHVDTLYMEIFWISVVFFIAIVGSMVAFAIMFRRKRGVNSKPPGHHTALELFWTFSPLILLAYMFHQGFDDFMMMTVPPETSINIRARAYKWRWSFEQPNGMEENGGFHVPINQPVRMIMSSVPNGARPQDGAVLHSFFVPAFRVKRDVVPGMYTSLWFEANHEGEYQVYCTEYCGTGHSRMLATVTVQSQADYDAFMIDGADCPDEFEEDWQWGQQLFSQNGCTACHSVGDEGSASDGPNLANVAGTMQPLQDNTEVLADAEYIRQSLREPQSQIVRGYGSVAMSPFNLANRELDAVISYLAHESSQGASIEVPQHCGDAAAQE